MTTSEMLKSMGYCTYTTYDEYTPVTKKQLNSIYSKYIGKRRMK